MEKDAALKAKLEAAKSIFPRAGAVPIMSLMADETYVGGLRDLLGNFRPGGNRL
jgi:hypothetical protein